MSATLKVVSLVRKVPHRQAPVFEYQVGHHFDMLFGEVIEPLESVHSFWRKYTPGVWALMLVSFFFHASYSFSLLPVYGWNVISQVLAPAACCHGSPAVLYSVPLEL